MGKRLLSMLLVFAMLFGVVATLAACDESGSAQDTSADTSNGSSGSSDSGDHIVSVKTIGGMPMSGLAVYIYAGSDLSDLKAYGETDENGKATFALAKGGEYYAVITGAPKGYTVEKSYPFVGNAAVITLSSSLIKDESLSSAQIGLGDVMYDFTVTTPDGDSYTLSEVLKEKKMVLLNFWYTTCTYCVAEFPYMQQAYEMYKDDVEIIAVNPMPTDNAAAIKNFQQTHELTFPMAQCQIAWANAFGVQGYPTSVVIDRYGVVCLIEAGGITSLRPFTSVFEKFTAGDYQQKIYNNIGELVSNVKPTYTMPSSDEINAAVTANGTTVTYRAEDGEDGEYSWPFIIDEKNGVKCIKASNKDIDSSYAIIYIDVELKAGQAIGFDYITSSELSMDVLHVIVDNEAIYQISGHNDNAKWSFCYPYVAEKDGTYEVALCYIKDESTNVGDDTVYIKNVRVINASDIDTQTFIPRYAATTKDGLEYTYVDIFYNEKDGYYHVGSVNGPLLLADLMNVTAFNEEESVYLMTYNGKVIVDGHNYYDDLLPFANHASNSALNGVCTVSKELAEVLKVIAKVAGFDGTENEWLKMCKYYQAYGTGNQQLEDPIRGLSYESAYEAKLGVGIESNHFYYNRPIIPRGLYAKFIPTKSGVYRITSYNNKSNNTLDGWIFDKNGNELYCYEASERMFETENEISMVYYMEKGVPYIIDIAFWDVYQTGYIYYNIEYVGAALDLFISCSPGYFTYDTDATGEAVYDIIAGGINVVLGNDGYYYEDLGKDANGKQKYGSLIYADFNGITSIFDSPIATVKVGNKEVIGLIDKGAFDFTKTEDDLYILNIMKQNDNDVEKTKTYLKVLWGEDYDAYAENYQLEDIFDGIYHGKGQDLTSEIRKYVSKVITDSKNPERQGCVAVDKKLAELLQLVMDKYTFEGVEYSWTKLCYYYDHLGPNN